MQSGLVAEDRAPGEVNYLRGNDPSRFQTGVPRSGTVVYRELWPHIDLAVHGGEGKLKYEFRVHPGGKPGDIRLDYTGASPLVLDQIVVASQLTTSTLPAVRMWWRVRARDGAGNPGAFSASRRFEVR